MPADVAQMDAVARLGVAIKRIEKLKDALTNAFCAIAAMPDSKARTALLAEMGDALAENTEAEIPGPHSMGR